MVGQKYELDIEHNKLNVEIEHEVSLITLGVLCLVLWAPCWWYDAEIRCAMGNQKACASLKFDPPKPN